MSAVAGITPAAAPDGAVRAVELAIGGMTCASCAARVERQLNKLDGVSAAVNLATETAMVTCPAAMPATELISVVEQAGYTAAVPAPPGGEPTAGQADDADRTDTLRRRLLVSAALAVPVVALAMIPPLQFRNWQWASLALASPVAVWGAWPFHRAAVGWGGRGWPPAGAVGGDDHLGASCSPALTVAAMAGSRPTTSPFHSKVAGTASTGATPE